MSKLHKRFLNRFNMWLASIIAILTGTTSCDPVVMYGPGPGPTFSVFGKVQNEAKEPLERMQVIINCSGMQNDTIHSNDEGIFGHPYDAIPGTIVITVNDTANIYESYTEAKKIKVSELNGDDFTGRSIHFDITLTKKAGVKEE
ncbi:MAG: hypothetical protein ACI3Z5_08105 [Paludibacteraceae bacterium]